MSLTDAGKIDKGKSTARDVGEGSNPQYDAARSQSHHALGSPHQAPEFRPPQDRTSDMHTDNFFAAWLRNFPYLGRREQPRNFPEAIELSTLPQQRAMEGPSHQPTADVLTSEQQRHLLSPQDREQARQQARQQGITLFMETPSSRHVPASQMTPTAINSFRGLKDETLRAVRLDLEQRMQSNPIPTYEEFRMGTFIQDIEPKA